jgi:putative transposase
MVGLDAGVRELAHLSDGSVIPNPKAFDQESKRLKKAKLSIARKQRAINKRLGPCNKGEHREESKRLQRAPKVYACLSFHVANIRKNALHKATTDLAKKYSVIVVEDLHGKNMTKACKGVGRAAKAGLNRVILDSGMLRLRPLLAYKMPLHGGRLVVVPAYYTSRVCSSCGSINDPGSSKTYKCETCGLVIDRDQNASLNILGKAAASLTAGLEDQKIFQKSWGAGIRPDSVQARKGRNIKGQSTMIRQLKCDHA